MMDFEIKGLLEQGVRIFGEAGKGGKKMSLFFAPQIP
jgi:hypothetical protein